MKITLQTICFVMLITLPCHAEEKYSVQSKYGGVVIPHLAITNSTLTEAMNQLMEACGRNSPQGTAPGVILKLNNGEDNNVASSDRKINLVTNNVLILEAFRSVAVQAGLEMTIEKTAIVIHPQKKEKTKVEQAR